MSSKFNQFTIRQTIEDYAEVGVPFLRTQNVRKLEINYRDLKYINEPFAKRLKKSQLNYGDVLVSRVGVNRGMAAVVPKKLGGANCANVLIVTPKNCIAPEYLAFLVNSFYGQTQLVGDSVGSAQGVINTLTLKEWVIPVASSEIQKQFAEIVQKFERVRRQQREAARQAEHLFHTLLHRAFRGEL